MTHDVFISFKNSDENGYQTIDSKIAKKLYDFLTKKGLRVFFSNIELEFTGKAQYSKVINKALDSSRFLVVVGSSSENLNSEWVYYEWDSFLNDIRSGIKPNAEVYVLCSGMKVSELPRALRQQQAFNANEKDAFEKLYRFIENALEGIPLETRERPVEEEIQTHSKTQETNKPQPVSVPMPMENSKLKPVNIKTVNPKPINKKTHTFPKLPKWMIPVIAGLVALVIGAVLMFNRERPVIQNQEYYNNIEEEGVVSFFPSGTLTIKTTSGDEYKAILNTVSGFPTSFQKGDITKELTLEDFHRAKFTYKVTEDPAYKSVTVHIYDDKDNKTVFVEDCQPFDYGGIVTFLSDRGMRYLSIEHIAEITKDERKTPEMPKSIRYAYICSGSSVYKVPQPLLIYKYGEPGLANDKDFDGIPHCGGNILRPNSLKYIRICKEAKGFGEANNTIYANVYFTDNSMISTSLKSNKSRDSYLAASTSLGNISLKITDIDEIFFGSYDKDFAASVAKEVWNGGKAFPYTGKGVATVHKKDGTSSVFALNSLATVGGNRLWVPTIYLVTEELIRTEKGTDVPFLCFSDIKKLVIKKRGTGFLGDYYIADYQLNSGETGEKIITGYKIEGITENGKESVSWEVIDRIDFDTNRNVNLSQHKKVIITSKNGCVFETLQITLFFCYPSLGMYSTYWDILQTVKTAGLSINYDKIRKIEFLPFKLENDKTLYPAKITLRDGGSQEFILDIAGVSRGPYSHFSSHLQFLTSIGVFNFNICSDVQSIEFVH